MNFSIKNIFFMYNKQTTMPIHESIKRLTPKLLRTIFILDEYAELMKMFDALLLEKLDKENTDALTEFIKNGIDGIYVRFESDGAIHPETLNILIRAIQVYNNNHTKPYPFPIYDDEGNNPTVMFMNDIVRRAVQRGELFDRTRGAYTKAQLEANTNMEEVDGGAKRKRTKRRHKRKHQCKSKRVKK
jgi:hypothetical protein